MNRKKIILKSSFILFVARIITSILSFVTRNAFIYGVGIDFLGLNGVIADVLAMLSLAELGFQSAIVYRLYKPIAEDDYKTVNQILNLLKKIYRVIGGIILVCGFCLIPALRYIITDISVSWEIIYISYILYVVSTAITYFMAYRRAFLYADQKQYVISLVDTLFTIAFGVLKILALVVVKSYILFVFLHLCQNISSNVVINFYVYKFYPWINIKEEKKNRELEKNIISDTKNVFAGKIAGYIYASTDNLVISAFISTKIIGYIGNYKTIFVTINTLLTSIFQPFQPMIGNYLISKDRKDAFALFNNYSFLRYAIVVLILNPTLVLADIFIKIWLGADYLMSGFIIYLLFFDIYISIVHGATGEFVEALGYFREAKKVYIMGAIINLGGSIVGAKFIGLEGVFGATILSQMTMWIGRSYIVFSKYFEDLRIYVKYWMKQILFFFNFIFLNIVSNFIFKSIIMENDILTFVVGGVVSVLIGSIDLILFFHKMPEFIYARDVFKGILNKIMKKIKTVG